MEELKVFKIGGNILDDPERLKSFLKKFAEVESSKILIHGGGRKLSDISSQLEIPVKMVDGRRITDEQTIEVAVMVYAGLLNKNIVATLQDNSCNALGFTGIDAGIIKAEKRPVHDVDYGMVGDIKGVNSNQLAGFLEMGIVPVFCAIAGDKGQLLNINADTVSSEVAAAMSDKYSVSFYYLFEKSGVLKDEKDDHSIIEKLDRKLYKELMDEGVIHSGMLPKLHNAFNALDRGVHRVLITSPEAVFDKSLPKTEVR